MISIFAFLGCLFFAKPVWAVNLPSPTGFVTDVAQVLSSQDRQSLEHRLVNLNQNTGHQIAILLVPSFDGLSTEEYSQKIFENWQIGQKKLDNGLLILIATIDRQLRIEVGYGLEAYITDARAGDIIRQQLTPNLQAGNYYQGLDSAITVIESHLQATPPTPKNSSSANSFNPLFLIFVPYLFSFLARSKSFWAGGLIGAIIGFIFFSWAWGLILGLIGLLLDLLLSRNYKQLRSSGLPTDFWHTSGGFKSGNSGFGGFGGGHSGGGGASGRF